eukprot:3161438-Heterocapsa_arctica.AAC.1
MRLPSCARQAHRGNSANRKSGSAAASQNSERKKTEGKCGSSGIAGFSPVATAGTPRAAAAWRMSFMT